MRKNEPDRLRSYSGSGYDGRTKQQALAEILSRRPVPDDLMIVEEVTAEFSGAFRTLAWYKSMYRQGKLSGMDGKPGHVIRQPNAGYRRRRK